MILSPSEYANADSYELLCDAGQGIVPMDHRLLHAIVDDPAKSLQGLVRYAREAPEGRFDLAEDLVNIARHMQRVECLPVLLAVLQNPDYLTLDLVEALREIGQPAVTALIEKYGEVDEESRTDIAFVLARLNVRDQRIFDLLVAQVADDPAGAAEGLALYGDPAAIPWIEASLAACANEAARMTVEAALATLRQGPSEWEEIEEPFDLWDLYPEEGEPSFDLMTDGEILAFLDSTCDEYRSIAAFELSDPELPEHLWDRVLTMAQGDASLAVRAQCWESLSAAAVRPDIRAAMLAMVDNEDAPARERTAALIGLAFSGTESGRLHHWLVAFYKNPDTRARSLEAMAVTADERYTGYFAAHLEDEDAEVRLSAIKGVGIMRIEDLAPRLIPLLDSEVWREEALSAYALAAKCEPSRSALRKLADKLGRLAGGLTLEENDIVCAAINVRAAADGVPPVFDDDGQPIFDAPAVSSKVGRNDPCPCGSGKKYKKCCGS